MNRQKLVTILVYKPNVEKPVKELIFLNLIQKIYLEHDKYNLTLDKNLAIEISQLAKYFDIWDSLTFKSEIDEYEIDQLYLTKFKP